jgi:hypothetical protein
MKKRTVAALVVLVLGSTEAACSSAGAVSVPTQGEGVNVGALPAEYRAEYALFAQRCSKCHSLARALNNGDHDAPYWARYVARMRRQPASGIALEDEPPILRFLNFYSAQQRAENGTDAGVQP